MCGPGGHHGLWRLGQDLGERFYSSRVFCPGAGRRTRAGRGKKAGSLLIAQVRGLKMPICKEKCILHPSIASQNAELVSQIITPSLQRLNQPQGPKDKDLPAFLSLSLESSYCPWFSTSSAGCSWLPLLPFPYTAKATGKCLLRPSRRSVLPTPCK